MGNTFGDSTSLEKAVPVGKIKKDLQGVSTEKLTKSGAWVINRDSQEVGIFRPFPKGKVILLTMTQFNPDGASKEENINILLMKEDWGDPQVMKEIMEMML